MSDVKIEWSEADMAWLDKQGQTPFKDGVFVGSQAERERAIEIVREASAWFDKAYREHFDEIIRRIAQGRKE